MAALEIAIAGCGTGGLAAAAYLEGDGHRVTLYERFAEPKPIGAGLMLQPTGLACLARLGLDEAIVARGRRIDGIYGRTSQNRTIFDLAYAELGPTVFGLGVHRGTLFASLLQAVVEAGPAIYTDVEIRATRLEDGKRLLIDATGHEHGPFDLVIDATGMRSPIRAAHADVRINRPNPYGAVWGVVGEPPGWPYAHELRQRYSAARVMIGILPIGQGPQGDRELCAVFWSLRTADYPAWREAGLDAWQRQVGQLWPEAMPFVEQFRSVDELTFASYADIVLRRPYAERLVFIGDAARTASPQLGQGANLALIDALVLSECLKRHATVAVALEAYAQARLPHTRFYGLASRWLTPFFQSDSQTAAFVRDLAFGPMGRVPYLRAEMVRTLAGIKTGLFSMLDPGDWHPRYRLDQVPTSLHEVVRDA